MLSMRECFGLPGAGNVISRAGTARAGARPSARALAAAAYGEIRAAENALNIPAVAFGAFQLCAIPGAGKKDLETFIAFQTLEFINRHVTSPKKAFGFFSGLQLNR